MKGLLFVSGYCTKNASVTVFMHVTLSVSHPCHLSRMTFTPVLTG
jgi:hypothetical protein